MERFAFPAVAAVDLIQQLFGFRAGRSGVLQKGQKSMLDSVHPQGAAHASAGSHFAVGDAAVVMIGAIGMAVGFPGHDTAAFGTADEAGEQMDLILRRRLADVTTQQILCFAKGIRVNDGLVGSGDPNPVLFGDGTALVDFVADRGVGCWCYGTYCNSGNFKYCRSYEYDTEYRYFASVY